MNTLAELSGSLVAGLAAGGVLATMLEIEAGSPAAFRKPFVARRRFLRSLAVTAVAGPYMLMAEGIDARRARRMSPLAMAACVATSLLWAASLGILLVRLAAVLSQPLG